MSMSEATFRFYEELNDFLPSDRRKVDFQCGFKGRESVKDMIEALGVPHTEVDLILVNGTSVDFEYILQDGDRISVYPVFESLDIADVTHLREIPLRETRFIADVNIHDIVTYMRALGLDVYLDPTLSPSDIIRISEEEKRTILTKSRKLLKHREVSHGIFIRPGTLVQQIRAIVDFLSLHKRVAPFSRCLRCNNPLVRVSKESVFDRIPPKARAFYDEYSYCSACDRIYWKGTHFVKIKEVVDEILAH
jgi:uncharacterized protein with PIN domain